MLLVVRVGVRTRVQVELFLCGLSGVPWLLCILAISRQRILVAVAASGSPFVMQSHDMKVLHALLAAIVSPSPLLSCDRLSLSPSAFHLFVYCLLLLFSICGFV